VHETISKGLSERMMVSSGVGIASHERLAPANGKRAMPQDMGESAEAMEGIGAGVILNFVVLHHTGMGAEHWDLLLRVPGRERLLTWRVAIPPEQWAAAGAGEIAATRIADHRALYMGYEGPVSGNRGQVKRVASGTATVLEQPGATLRLRLAGQIDCALSLPMRQGVHDG
jgi:hypothetical protein